MAYATNHTKHDTERELNTQNQLPTLPIYIQYLYRHVTAVCVTLAQSSLGYKE